jgi:hypothetical protein
MSFDLGSILEEGIILQLSKLQLGEVEALSQSHTEEARNTTKVSLISNPSLNTCTMFLLHGVLLIFLSVKPCLPVTWTWEDREGGQPGGGEV